MVILIKSITEIPFRFLLHFFNLPLLKLFKIFSFSYFFLYNILFFIMAFNLLLDIFFCSIICAFFFFGLNLTVGDLNQEDEQESILWVIKILCFLFSTVLLFVYLYYTQYSITQIAILFFYVFGLGLLNHMLGDKIFNYLTSDDNTFTRKFLLSLGLLVLAIIYGSLFWFSWLYLLQV